MRKFALLCALTAALGAAQDLAFEVATIHPAGAINTQAMLTGNMTLGMSVNGNQVNFRYMSLRDLAVAAYEVKPFDVTAPEWTAQQRFDISALMPAGATKEQVPAMLRTLLRDRFKMVAHKDTKEADVYAMTVARDGHKMKPSPELPPPPPPSDQPEADPAKATGPGMTVNGQRMNINQSGATPGGGGNFSITGGANGAQKVSVSPEGNIHMEIERLTMKELADQLGMLMDLPVEDHTELQGPFQVALDMSMADMMGIMSKVGMMSGAGGLPPEAQTRLSQMAANDPGGLIQGSVQKLGLKLDKQKGSISMLVIESAEKQPTEN